MTRTNWLSFAACITAALGAGIQFAIVALLIIQDAHASPIPCFCNGCLLLALSVWNGIVALKN